MKKVKHSIYWLLSLLVVC